MHTIKQVADRIGISKVAVTNKLKELGLYDELIQDGNRKIIPTEIEAELMKAYEHRRFSYAEYKAEQQAEQPHRERKARSNTANDEVIQILREQLELANRQIEALTEQNAELTTAIRESHQLQLMLTGSVGTTEAVEQEQATEQPQKKRRWWNR